MELHQAYYFNFSPQTIFNAWIDPNICVPPVTKMEIEPKVDGKLVLHSDNELMVGRFLQLEPGFRMLYTWHWEGSDEHTQVSILLNTFGAGCLLSMLHKGFKSRKSYEMHKTWWDHYVNELKLRLKSQTASSH